MKVKSPISLYFSCLERSRRKYAWDKVGSRNVLCKKKATQTSFLQFLYTKCISVVIHVAQHRDATLDISSCSLILYLYCSLDIRFHSDGSLCRFLLLLLQKANSQFTNFLCLLCFVCVKEELLEVRSYELHMFVWCFAAGKIMKSFSYRHDLNRTCGTQLMLIHRKNSKIMLLCHAGLWTDS